MSHNEIVLSHMRRIGPITHHIADRHYGITRVAARIYDLRRKGTKIETTRIKSENGKRFARYSLISET